MENNRNFWLPVIFAIGIVYILLRLWRLTDACLWFDEIFSIHAAEYDWQTLFWFVAQDLIHPPLFYALLKIWIALGGESLFWLRFFPVFFSCLALVPFYFLCRQFELKYSTIAAALSFLAVNGALIKYTQTLRMYTLLMFFALFSFWLFIRYFRLGKSFWILTFVNIALIYAHYYGWLVILAEIIAILILQRIKIARILMMFGICLLAFTPWIYTVWQAMKINADFAQNLGWASKPNFPTLFLFLFDLIEPIYFQAASNEWSSIFIISVPVLLLIIGIFVLYFVNWQAETEKEKVYLLTIFILTPILSAFLASWLLPVSIWGTRHLIIVFAPFSILLAHAWNKITFPQAKTGILIAFCMFVVFSFAREINRPQTTFIWCGWENLAPNVEAGEKVYAFENLAAYHFWFARRKEPVQVVRLKDFKGIMEDPAYFLPRGFDAVRTTENFEGERFWITYRDTEWNLQKPPLQNLIQQGYRISEPKVFETESLKVFLVEVAK
ncbi:MAG TPA: glycosyltransferase family 39 protein [Pyrinomonadaceae bacterium]|nr:glycosyltransferase family 39 protein [Pyrinomonadaceae bacterium]